MSKLSGRDIVNFLKFFITVWGKRRGGGYVAFGRIGTVLVGLGVSVLVPGLWEMLAEAVLRVSLGVAEDLSLGIKLAIALPLILFGIGLIGLSFWLLHRIVSKGPSTVNDGAISTTVVPGTSLESLILSTADQGKISVNLDQLSASDRALPVATGVLRASDFEDFLSQVAQRTAPALQLKWERSDNFYRLSA